MRRKKPTSSRQKKEELKIRRAVKRGDISPPPPKHRDQRKKTRHPNIPAESSKRLQSSFVKPTQKYLDQTKLLASTVPLLRPIPPEAAIFTKSYTDRSKLDELTCPRRPKWRYDMSKKDVERNEEGLHKKWLEQTDKTLEKWRLEDVVEPRDDIDQEPEEAYSIRSPSSFERNLEVWRQLWRVTEISQIILVLVDSRCPLLHYPPSLASFLSNRKVIIVLTKTDITGPVRSNAWVDYLRGTIPGLRIVQVQSYSSKEPGFYHQGRVGYEARIPQMLREQLIDAIRDLHAQLLEPPEKEKISLEGLRNWKPPVKRDINWGVAESVHAQQANANHDVDAEDGEPPFLTIGLVGQPNVGKSSLLNSLFGESKVRASKTPGKTKHYQTLFLTPEIRLVDCPGLVMPNYVPMEMQVLSGVLPISRVSAIPACIHYILQLLPLEETFKLTHPNATEPPVADKRTWREGMKRAADKSTFWTAMDVLVAFANKKGWVTAKAGRPDVSRAGNAILRAVAEGQVPWGFWPPGTSLSFLESNEGRGILIQQDDWEYVSDGEDRVSSDEDDDHTYLEAEEESSDDDDDGDDVRSLTVADEDDGARSLTVVDEDESDEDELDVDPESAIYKEGKWKSTTRFAILQPDDTDTDTDTGTDTDVE